MRRRRRGSSRLRSPRRPVSWMWVASWWRRTSQRKTRRRAEAEEEETKKGGAGWGRRRCGWRVGGGR